jgi:hypothetical protein
MVQTTLFDLTAAQERELCCKDMCQYCAASEPYPLIFDGKVFWHIYLKNLKLYCYATPIRLRAGGLVVKQPAGKKKRHGKQPD